MGKFSVLVDGISDRNKFLSNIFTEIGTEISTEVNENEVLFLDVDSGKTEKLYDTLAKNILNEFSKKILVKIINKNCDYFSKEDKYEVWKMSMRHILDDEIENNSDYLYRIETVKNKLKGFLSKSNYISVEGFVNFRLQELEDEYDEIVEECVQDYLLELEYVEFINMLKYFVAVQSPKYLTVNVVYDENIYIYADGKNITMECKQDFNSEGSCTEDNIDDYLLNSLISIAPKRIIIKEKKKLNEEIKKTLLGIFGDKLKITTE